MSNNEVFLDRRAASRSALRQGREPQNSQASNGQNNKQPEVCDSSRVTAPVLSLGDDGHDDAKDGDTQEHGGQRNQDSKDFAQKLIHLFFLLLSRLVSPTFLSGVAAGLVFAWLVLASVLSHLQSQP